MGALAALSVMVDGTKTLLSAAEERFVIFEYSFICCHYVLGYPISQAI